MVSDISTLSARTLLNALRRGDLTAEDGVQCYLRRIAQYDGALNTIACIDPTALDQARALDRDSTRRSLPLFGLPILIKDNIDVQGLPTTAGSLALTDNIARQDAPIVARLRQQGAVILGKTNLTEFANYTTQGMPNGFSSRGGQVKHAYGPGFDPGGSSSGSGVAMSAAFCAAAIGTDTSFSVVGCAAQNGICGLKPANGTLPIQGIIPIAHTLDMPGVMARDMDDALLIYHALRPEMPPIQPLLLHELRIAVNTYRQEDVSAAQMDCYHRLFDALKKAGATLTQVRHESSPALKDVMQGEFRRDLEAYLTASAAACKTLPQLLSQYRQDPVRMMPYGVTVLERALHPEKAAYLAALDTRSRIRAELLETLAPYHACVMTGPCNIMHLAGLPSLALPLCMGTDGAPRGIILYGADETHLHAAALALQSLCLPIAPPHICIS